MNKIKRVILVVGITIFSLSELFPPWLYEDNWNSTERSAGYHFAFASSPEVKSYSEMKKLFLIPDQDPTHNFSVRRDILRLYTQRSFILFLMLGIMLILDNRISLLKTIFGYISICLGFGFLGLYILQILDR